MLQQDVLSFHKKWKITKSFSASNSWVHSFLKRNGFVFKSCKLIGLSNYYTKRQMYKIKAAFLKKLKKMIQRYTVNGVYNMDETSNKLIPNMKHQIAIKNQPRFLSIRKYNNKQCYTLACTVCANGDKLPTVLIAKGKTQVCLEKFELSKYTNADISGHYNVNGYIDYTSIEQIIQNIKSHCHNQRCCLVIDSNRVHTSNEIEELAKTHDVDLLFVPSYMTGTLQPLDVGVFGVLKSTYKHFYEMKNIMKRLKSECFSWSLSLQCYHFSWSQINSQCIKNAFEKVMNLLNDMT